MLWHWTAAVIIEIAAAVGLFLLAIYIPGRDMSHRTRLIAVTLTLDCALWMLAHALEIGLPLAAYKSFFLGAQLVFGMAAMTLWLLYIVLYTRPGKWLARANLILFSIVVPAAVTGLLTNGIFGLMWTDPGLDSRDPYLPLQPTYGSAYWGCMIYAAAMALGGSTLIVRHVLRFRHRFSRHAAYLLAAAVIPLLSALIEVSGVTSALRLPVGITPWLACAAVIILLLNMPLFKIQQVMPVARNTVFDSIDDCILVLDMENRVLDMNARAEQLVNRRISDAFGLSIEQVWPYLPIQLPLFASQSKPGVEITIGQAGNQLTFDMRISTVTNKDDRPAGKVILLSDMTSRKQAVEALHRSEERFRMLAENSEDVIWTTDVNQNFTYFSPSIRRLQGYEPEEAMRLTADDLLTPESLSAILREIEKNSSAIEQHADKFVHIELEEYHKNGTRFWVEANIRALYDAGGNFSGFIGVSRDITQRKLAEQALMESEEKYRNVVDNAGDSILITQDGYIKFVNRWGTQTSVFTLEDLQAKQFIEFVHPDDREILQERQRNRLESGEVPPVYECRFLDSGGHTRWAEIKTIPVQYEGKPAMLNIIRDIGELRRLREERQRIDKLESVGTLAGGIAHDFNNILAAILGNLSLAVAIMPPGEEATNLILEAEKASLRARNLSKQLLTFARGGAPVKKTMVLGDMLKDSAIFALRGSRVSCNFYIDQDLWPAEVDEGQIVQVISNLVINARQAMPSGGEINVSAYNITLDDEQVLGRIIPLENGNYIRISVSDSGSGIPPEHLDKIFDPYFTTRQAGSGLGLSICHSIVRNHGGHISVESNVGQGTTFYIYLPASHEKPAAEAERPAANLTPGELKLLIMDDEASILDVTGRLLRHLGYRDIAFAPDGETAVEMYRAAKESGRPFDATILDFTVPGKMDGVETVAKLQKLDPGVRAIIASGYADDAVMSDFARHGFKGALAKPYTVQQLGQMLAQVMNIG